MHTQLSNDHLDRHVAVGPRRRRAVRNMQQQGAKGCNTYTCRGSSSSSKRMLPVNFYVRAFCFAITYREV